MNAPTTRGRTVDAASCPPLARRARPASTGCPTPVAGARAVVLLVLDGLGWDALDAHRGVHARARRDGRRADHHRRAVDHRRPRSRRSPPGSPPSQHGIIGFRIRVDGDVLNVLRWQLADGPAAARPVHGASATRRSSGAPVPVVTKAEFRSTGFTDAHLRGTRVPRLADRRRSLVEHCRALVAGGRAGSSTRTTRASTRSRTSTGSTTPYYPAELAAADRLVGRVLDALPDRRRAARHRRPRAGARRARRLARARRRCDPLVAVLRRRRPVPLPARAQRRGRRAARGRASELCGDEAWVFTREQLLDEGWLGPDPVARDRAAGSATSCSRPRDRSAFVDPTLPQRGQPRSAPTGRSPPPRCWSRCVAGRRPRPTRAERRSNHSGVIHPQALSTGLVDERPERSRRSAAAS